MTDTPRLGDQIRLAREKLGWSQEVLAERYLSEYGRGASIRAIQTWESNVQPPRGRTLANLRVLLEMEGTEEETRSEWPFRVRNVVEVLCDELNTLPPARQKEWRHAFIVGLLSEGQPRRRMGWSDDVEVVADIIGAYLAAIDVDEGP